MIKWLRNIIEFMLPWYDSKDAERRDEKTRAIHQKSDRVIREADSLIEQYAAADRAIRKHQRLWRSYNN